MGNLYTENVEYSVDSLHSLATLYFSPRTTIRLGVDSENTPRPSIHTAQSFTTTVISFGTAQLQGNAIGHLLGLGTPMRPMYIPTCLCHVIIRVVHEVLEYEMSAQCPISCE